MNVKAAFPSNYIKASDIGDDDRVVTIDKVEQETIGQGKDKEEKLILHFRGMEKGLVLNKTNANTISSLHGDETDDWAGKQVTLYTTEVQYGDEMMLGIRIRLRQPKGKSTPSNGGPTAPIDTDAKLIRRDAWTLFSKSRPGKTADELSSAWVALCKEVGGGKDQHDMTASDWIKVKSRAVPTDDVVSDIPEIDPADIPY